MIDSHHYPDPPLDVAMPDVVSAVPKVPPTASTAIPPATAAPAAVPHQVTFPPVRRTPRHVRPKLEDQPSSSQHCQLPLHLQ